MTWFTSDTHLGHSNIIKHCNRDIFMNDDEERAMNGDVKGLRISYDTTMRMDQYIIDRINEKVGVNDILWHLGDFCMPKYVSAQEYREKINCKNVNLVLGNHDKRSDTFCRLFSSTSDLKEVRIGNKDIVLCHYPMLSWNRSCHGSWHLFGHVHDRVLEKTRDLNSMNVGVDQHDFCPINIDTIMAYIMGKRNEEMVE